MSVRADLLAAKLESGTFDDSQFAEASPLRGRWRELLWFIQAAAIPPGELDKLIETLLRHYAARFCTASMLEAGAPVDGKYTVAQCLTAWKTFDSRLSPSTVSRFGELRDEETHMRAGDSDSFPDWMSMHFDPDCGIDCAGAAAVAAAERFNWPFLNKICLSLAQSKLARFLDDLCTESGTRFSCPWYCADLFNILLDYMDAFAARIESGITKTEVTRTVFRELEFACAENVPVPIIGDSRIGKTSSVSVWCSMRPGRARLVTVPESNNQRDFLRAHADAFGIEYAPSTTAAKLKWDVEFVHRRAGLFIAYDEAHFLVPVKYHKSTPPARIEWIRNQVVERELRCAFLATPQSYHQTLDEFAKGTAYNFEQWLGRMSPPVMLRADLASQDMMAVAKLHFPDWPEPYLKLIAARAITSEGYLKSLQFTAKRARFIARERGHDRVLLDDVKDAIADMMPGTAVPPVDRADPAAPAPALRTPAAPPPLDAAEPAADLPPPARRGSLSTVTPEPETVPLTGDRHALSPG